MKPSKKNQGPNKLRAHIDRNYDGSISRFAREHGFDVSELARILREERGSRMTVRLAARIEAACKGKSPEVPIKAWVS